MVKTISVSLSPRSVGAAIREIEKYRKSLDDKAETLRRRIAERIAMYASHGFQSSVSDTRLDGAETPRPRVDVTVEDNGNITTVLASGEDAIWIEFGAGVYYNTPAGSSPHPMGAQLGLTIGSYGKGHGAKNVWGYIDEQGELVLTHGTPAAMPLYKAALRVAQEYPSLAREVFGA